MGSIPGSGRFPGGERGSPLQYSCQENPMEWDGESHGESHGQRSLAGYSSWGLKETDTTE